MGSPPPEAPSGRESLEGSLSLVSRMFSVTILSTLATCMSVLNQVHQTSSVCAPSPLPYASSPG